MRDGSFTRRVSSYLPLCVASLLVLGGCDNGPAATKTPAVPVSKGHAHDHSHEHGAKGPHDGALVSIGDEIAHLEVVFDAETGKITAYVLDGEAKNSVKIKTDKLDLTFVAGHHHDETGDKKAGKEEKDDDVTGTVTLTALEPDADGLASVFSGVAEALKGAKEFDAVVESIKIDKAEFKKQKFNWPEGNDDHHHH